MIKRIKNLWNLSNANQEVIDKAIEAIREHQEIANYPIIRGNGKAEFLGEGTLEEFQRQEENDKGFIKRVFGL